MDDMWNLPRSIELGGEQYEVRTDFRAILDILGAMAKTSEPNEEDRIEVLFDIFFLDAEEIPQEYLQEAIDKAFAFIDCGISSEGKNKARLMD